MKRSVSVAIRFVQPDGAERVVAVLRPRVPDDPLGGLWGLPAATARDGESEDEAAARVLRDKLGLQVSSEGLTRINEGWRDDGDVEFAVDDGLCPRLVWRIAPARLIAFARPRFRGDSETVTLYEDWRWAAPEELREAAGRGSLCTRLYLEWLEG